MFTVTKVLITTQFFPPSEEPTALYSYYLARELKNIGIRVKILTPWNNETCGAKSIDGFEMFCIPTKKVMGKFYYIKQKYYKEIKKEISDFKPDAVVTNDYFRSLSLMAARASRELDKHCLTINHLMRSLSDKSKIINRVLERLEFRAMHLHKKYHVTFAASARPMAEYLKQQGAVPRHIIPFGMELTITPLPTARRKHGLKDDSVLFVLKPQGDMQRVRRIERILNEISEITGPETELIVIGKKPAGEDFLPNIKFTGMISKEDEVSVKFAGDVYIHFADSYTLDDDFLEAGIFSRAVMCIPEGDTRFDTLTDMEDGVVVRTDEKIKAMMQKLRVHKKVRDILGENLRQKVESHHNWKESAAELTDAVWLLNGGRRRM